MTEPTQEHAERSGEEVERSKGRLIVWRGRPTLVRHPRGYWEDKLGAEGIPYAAVLSIPEVHEDPEVQHSGIFERLEHPQAGTVTMMRRPARIDRSRGPRQALPALLGEHTEAVLRDAGYGSDEIEKLRSAGAIDSSSL